MTALSMDFFSVLERAQRHRAVLSAAKNPTKLAWFTVVGCGAGMSLACVSEFASLTIAMESAFPQLSSGEDLGSIMMALRWPIIAVLLLSEVLTHKSGSGPVGRLAQWLRYFRMVPLLAVVLGLGIFMFTATAAATGDGQGGLSGVGLGLGLACMFSVSLLVSNALAARFFPAMRTIIVAREQQATIAVIDRDIGDADRLHASIESRTREVCETETGDRLARRAAAEAAAIVGKVRSDFHNVLTGIQSLPDDLRREDEVNIPDVSPAVLERIVSELEKLDVEFFLNQLKRNSKEG